ncbi:MULTISPECIES: DUF452 family protein [unclassified Carboxylicivirga]|uniref:DUF452 family protein n=1 Tax=Carboxylicivirga TaxID=1628153 RepID=UPI003D32F55D
MKYTWLHKNYVERLILFFNGWSCDEQPFRTIGDGGNDVLMVYDYRDLALPNQVIEAMEQYQSVSVVAWSFGVWVAQVALGSLKYKLERTIAVNGTGAPVDKALGIPAPIAMGTLSGLNDRNLQKFQRRMFCTKEHWALFRANQPVRPLDEVKDELFLLLQHVKVQNLTGDFYDTALIGSCDLIFPAANQHRYWKDRAAIIELEQGHFCFYEFESWEQIIHLTT